MEAPTPKSKMALVEAFKRAIGSSNTLVPTRKQYITRPEHHKNKNHMHGARNKICPGCGHKNKKCTCKEKHDGPNAK